MSRLLVSLALALLSAVAAPASAKDARSTVDDKAPPEAVARFLVGTRLGYITCGSKYRSYLERWDLYALINEGQSSPKSPQPSDEEVVVCVHETVPKGRDLYTDAARRATAPAARSALREYMTAWEASLVSLPSKGPEKPADFDARFRKQEARLDELQRRLESATR